MDEPVQKSTENASANKAINPVIVTIVVALVIAAGAGAYAVTRNDQSTNQTDTSQTTEDDESSSLPTDDEPSTQNSGAGSGDDSTDQGDGQAGETVSAPEYIGLSEAEARQLATDQGKSLVVVMRDGDSQEVTLDYQPGRINIELVNDFVIKAYVE